MEEGIIVLSHGSRSKESQKEFEGLIKYLKEYSKQPILGASLEFSQPDFWSSLEYLVEKIKVKKVLVIPLFVFAGKHVRRDLPDLIDQAKLKYLDVDFEVEAHLGGHALFKEMLVNMIEGSDL